MVAYSFNKRFVSPIRVGLGIKIHHEPGDAHVYTPKRQTIRATGKRRHARPGETLQLYHGMRTKQCFKIGEARCTDVVPIIIRVPRDDAWLSVKIADEPEKLADDAFAQADGFASVEDMWLFWRQEHPLVRTFTGFLIRWESL